MQLEPIGFEKETTTVWSFPNRGKWATHSGSYRGNWSPYVPRNLLLRYSKKGDWVLDQFSGSGTTLIEAKLLKRNAIGVDINADAVILAKQNLEFDEGTDTKVFVKQGDAAYLNFIKSASIDFICTHPPYANIIKYSRNIENDLSLLNVSDFLAAMQGVAAESLRVLKNRSYLAIMMGDVRNRGKVIPLGFGIMQCFLRAGFCLQEIIIKEQHNCRVTRAWEQKDNAFLLLAHEYIFVYQKLA